MEDKLKRGRHSHHKQEEGAQRAINHLFPEQNRLPHLTVLIDYDADPTGNGTSLGLNEEHYDKYLGPQATEPKTGSTQEEQTQQLSRNSRPMDFTFYC